MAQLRPFRAHRPPTELAVRVASPPYDVVSTAQARALAQDNPDSFLYVSRPEISLPEGTDEHADEVYATGAANLASMIERGALVQDEQPRLYVYAQQMGDHRQVGVVGCAAVAEYLDDRILKHERTRPDKENDRVRHIDELGAHDEPVFLSYRAVADIDRVVAEHMQAPPSYDFASDDGVHHRLWVLDAAASEALAAAFRDRVPVMYVADGHHRSAAAARVHERRGDGPGEHDAFLVVVFPHDQMNILPYNRVVKDRAGRSADELLEALRGQFASFEPSDVPAPERSGDFGVYLGGRWYRATAKPLADDADPVQRLDCAICQDHILAPVFDITDPRRDQSIAFVGGIHGAGEIERRVDAGEADVGLYLFPTRMSQVMDVSDAGLVMPPKSTWFEPKLKSGLFVHRF
jgi:uncharacterized protein (DUF1015 family)